MLTQPLIAARDTLFYSLAGGLPVSLEPAPLPFRADQLGVWGLRDYQIDLLLEALHWMRLGYRRILIVLPTGGGKTKMAAAMLGSASRLAFTSQFMVHRKELINQTSDEFASVGIAHGFVAADRPMDLTASVIIAGIQTLAKRLGLVLPPNLAILDEAHHASAATWERVLAAYIGAFVIGLTATPERLDGRGLREHFDVMIVGPSPAELTDWGYLSPFEYYAPTIPDTSDIATLAGDFNKAAIDDLMDRPKIIGDIVEHYLRLARGKRGLVFSTSRKASERLADAFRGEGVRAAHVDGDSDDRDARMKQFKGGELEVLTNVDIYGEGVDAPGVVYLGMGRPSKSKALVKQQWGRDLRAVYADGFDRDTQEGRLAAIAAGPKPFGIICDHAGNVFNHGFPDDDVEWSLDGKAARARAGANDASPVHTCLTCYRVTPSRLTVCPGCGTVFPIQSREIETEAGTLTKLERDELRKAEARKRTAEEKACRSQGELEQLAQARGYEFPRAWAKRIIAGRHASSSRFRR